MKRYLALLLTAAVLLCCSGCSEPTRTTFFCMDTVMELTLYGSGGEQAAQEITWCLQELENRWSATKEDSALSRWNRGETVIFTEEERVFLQDVQALSLRTGGAFDPQLLALSQAWDFTGESHRVPDEAQIREALGQKQWDLGGVLKGYAGQQAVGILENRGVDCGILNLGGNIQTYGEKPDGTPWQIGIQNPDGGSYIGILSVTGTVAVVTSGDYQRYFTVGDTRYHHILDPETGYPADAGLRSVTVICRDGTTADALSTALFVMGLEEGTQFWRQSADFEAVFLLSDGRIYATEGAALSGCEYEVIWREN